MSRRALRALVAVPLTFLTLLLVAVLPAQADFVITLGGADFSDTTDNTGGTVTVTIADIGVGDVQVTILNSLVDPGAFVGALYLNTTAAPLSAPSDNGTCVSPCVAVSYGSNAFKADGDGFYDILVSLANGAAALEPGDSVTFSIFTDSAGFTADSFNTLSLDAGGHGPFVAAAHIQSLPNGGSDWIAGNGNSVPEPGTLAFLGSGLLTLATVLRFRKR